MIKGLFSCNNAPIYFLTNHEVIYPISPLPHHTQNLHGQLCHVSLLSQGTTIFETLAALLEMNNKLCIVLTLRRRLLGV